MSKDYTKELGDLGQRLGEILLMVVDPVKISTAAELMNKYSREFYDNIKNESSNDKVGEYFDHFINTEMSVVETLGISEKQFRPTRKLILNEMYRFRKDILKLEPKAIANKNR